MNPPPYLWVYIIFACVTITSLVLFGIASTLRTAGGTEENVRGTVRSAGILLFGWMALALALGATDMFRPSRDQVVPLIAFAIVIPVIAGAMLIRRSETVVMILRAVPQSLLVGIQCYRGFGSMFLVLYGTGFLPAAFALPAGFGDVLVGFSALVVAALYAAGNVYRDRLVLLWNILGIADLVIAVGTGFLSSPSRIQLLSLENPNFLMGIYPAVMIPIFAVPLSIVLHIASLTKLAREKEAALQNSSK